MRKPLQHQLMEMLDEPTTTNDLCELLPGFGRDQIRAALQALKHFGKVQVVGVLPNGSRGVQLWQRKPEMSANALMEAWPMPCRLPMGEAKSKRVHRMPA